MNCSKLSFQKLSQNRSFNLLNTKSNLPKIGAVICRRNHGSSNGSHNGRSANYFAYLASGLAGATLTAAAVAAYQLAEKNQQPDAKAFHSKNKEGVKMKKCDHKRVR